MVSTEFWKFQLPPNVKQGKSGVKLREYYAAIALKELYAKGYKEKK